MTRKTQDVTSQEKAASKNEEKTHPTPLSEDAKQQQEARKRITRVVNEAAGLVLMPEQAKEIKRFMKETKWIDDHSKCLFCFQATHCTGCCGTFWQCVDT